MCLESCCSEGRHCLAEMLESRHKSLASVVVDSCAREGLSSFDIGLGVDGSRDCVHGDRRMAVDVVWSRFVSGVWWWGVLQCRR